MCIRDRILLAVFYVLMLSSFTWQTMTATAVAYLAFLPFSVKLYARRLQRERREQDVARGVGTPDAPGTPEA